MKFGICIMAPSPISTTCFINSSFSNTNTTPSEIILVITLILLEFQTR
jgi:hypothetical protein